MATSKIYQVMAVEDVTEDMWNDAYETKDSAQYNDVGTKVYLSYRGDKPASFVTDPFTEVWSVDEMINDILSQDEWYIPDPEGLEENL